MCREQSSVLAEPGIRSALILLILHLSVLALPSNHLFNLCLASSIITRPPLSLCRTPSSHSFLSLCSQTRSVSCDWATGEVSWIPFYCPPRFTTHPQTHTHTHTTIITSFFSTHVGIWLALFNVCEHILPHNYFAYAHGHLLARGSREAGISITRGWQGNGWMFNWQGDALGVPRSFADDVQWGGVLGGGVCGGGDHPLYPLASTF